MKIKRFNDRESNKESDKDLIKSTDALTMYENDWNEKYPGLVFSLRN